MSHYHCRHHSSLQRGGTDCAIAQARSSPNTSPVLRQSDELPAFPTLTTDDERERKAGTQRPGTFGVVVTPESFSDLPEYADAASPTSSRKSGQSRTSSFASQRQRPTFGRSLTRSRTDPNVVVLDRFEDVSPISAGPASIASDSRRPSLPDNMQYLSISTSSSPISAMVPPSPLSQVMRADDDFIAHFRHSVSSRLVQPQLEGAAHEMTANPTRDAFVIEAMRFQPLHHAICAVSALNLLYDNRSTMEEALQHYHQALSSQTAAASSPEELFSDGAFLRHYLLFIYDICVPMQNAGGADMWAIHLTHLRQIATLRHERLGRDPHAYILWATCELDMYACLLGSGKCEFIQTVLQHNMLPPLDQQIPPLSLSLSGPYLANEISLFPPILNLNQGVVIQTAKLAQLAQNCRSEAADRHSVSPGVYARWQASVSQLQAELGSFWAKAYPEFLAPESSQAGRDLPPRVRYVFEHVSDFKILVVDSA